MLENLRNILWSPLTVILIAALGIALSVKTKLRAIKNPLKNFKSTLFSGDKNKSSFEATFTALGGTIGVGNTIGVAGALKEGGAGALFWMLVASIFGMVIKEAEIFMAVKYKRAGWNFSGPMCYIESGLGSSVLAKIWAISCILTAFGMGNMSQTMAAVRTLELSSGMSNILLSIMTAFIITAFLSIGSSGLKKAVSVTVALLSVSFVVISITVLTINRQNLPYAIATTVKSAFSFAYASIGIKWSLFATALRTGFSRGIFTNEAGLGSASVLHSSSDETSPEKQSMWGVIEVFIDTVVICTITGGVILTSGLNIDTIPTELVTISVYTQALGKFGNVFYTVSTLFFAVASVVAWYCYAECSLTYLGVSEKSKIIFKAAFILASFIGGIIKADNILYISDIFNAIMLITNVGAMFLMLDKAKSD